jgi:hypothetical protein
VLSHVTALRYVVPLREGGSLPGIMEADDEGTYVVKFSGAGQGIKTLAAEVIAGGVARRLGLPVPDLVTVDVDPALAVGEPDQEVQELLRASAGLNLGIDYLPGALDFEAAANDVAPELAGRVLWFDALVGNVDRSWRNPNMLFWHGRLHMIDHGATLTFHHAWSGIESWATRPYDASAHALLECSPDVPAADGSLARAVTADVLRGAVADVPEKWLAGASPDEPPDAVRQRYVDALHARLAARDRWLPPLVEAVQTAATVGRRESAAPQRGRPRWLGGTA